MCGLTGFFDAPGRHDEAGLRRLGAAMTGALHHRGPDDGGLWVDAAAGVVLGHRRLSIVDLSPAGHQPMASADGRFVVAYNGEIYNAADLRGALPHIAWRGHSDTEVLVEGCAAWGVEATVARLIGMFAFALWDRRERRLWLVRDRLGIKPLYWGRFGELFLFGSELKALRAHPGWPVEVDRGALAGYLRHNYVPAPHSIYRGVRKLPPGTVLSVAASEETRLVPFWSMGDVAHAGVAEPLALSDAEAEERLDALLRDAVRRRMVADVPLGAFLSGGIDSSVVVALMQAQNDRPVKTFTIGFHERGYDEARHAKAVAAHLGTDHTELYVDPAHALEVIPRLPEWFDEPFADSSQIPTFLVSEMTRRHVTVALSGDGGDELFAGYNRYFWGERLWRRLGWLPPGLRAALADLLTAPAPAAWDRLFAALPASLRPPQPGDKVHKLAGLLGLPDQAAIYRRLVSHWEGPAALVPGATEATIPWALMGDPRLAGFVARMQRLDTVTYLPDDILTKVDRCSMAVSLEARVPLLDHRVVAFAWRLPMAQKIRGGEGKWLLRRVLGRYVPDKLIDRPKMGFGVPIDVWLRGPLRDWAEALLDPARLRDEGFLDPDPIRRLWSEHLGGRRNWQYLLWDVLMFQAWRERWMAAAPVPAGQPA